MTAAIPRRGLRTLWLILAVCAAPMIAAFAAYYLMPARDSTANYGELLPTQPAPALAGTRADGGAWSLADERGHWVVLIAMPAACDEACAKRLYATRQARTMQGKDRSRVSRVWLVTGEGTPSAGSLGEHPDVTVVRADARGAERLPLGANAIHLIDPLGNQVLAWPGDPDIRGVAKDLGRLLRASRIG